MALQAAVLLLLLLLVMYTDACASFTALGMSRSVHPLHDPARNGSGAGRTQPRGLVVRHSHHPPTPRVLRRAGWMAR
jgi:hypothetical protein